MAIQCENIYKRDLQRVYPAQTMTQRLEVKAERISRGFFYVMLKGLEFISKVMRSH